MELRGKPAATIEVPAVLDRGGVADLEGRLAAAARAPGPVVVLRGAGPGSFCTGMDVAAIAGDDAGGDLLERMAGLLLGLRRLPRVVIAVVEGPALGGGLGIVAAADHAIAEEAATFGLPEGLFGLAPAIVWPFIEERVPPQRLRALGLAAGSVDAAAARGLGLVDVVVPRSRLDAEVGRAGRQFSRSAADGIAAIKAAPDGPGGSLESRVERGLAVTRERLASPAVRARLDAWQRGEAPWEIS